VGGVFLSPAAAEGRNLHTVASLNDPQSELVTSMSIQRILLLVLAWGHLALAIDVEAGPPVLLFPYFDSNGENGVYMAWSDDGRTFHAVNDAKPIFEPPKWNQGQHLTRDPSIVYHDATFHMVWTSNWSGRWFGYASSPDLREWSEPVRIQPFPKGSEQPTNVWAPELFRDAVADDFKIVWSSTLRSELDDGDRSEDTHGNDHRMYFVSTHDFQEFSAPRLLFRDQNYSVIDAHVAYDDRGTSAAGDDRWVMSLKKELPADRDGKNIRLAFSPPTITAESFASATSAVVGPGTKIQSRQAAEGPSLVRWNEEWLLYWDSYGARHYSLATSTDLETWTDETAKVTMPAGHPRHGSVFVADRDAVGWTLSDGE
jgi:predicted GH43/DUF377 family glycosyl hydrolase